MAQLAARRRGPRSGELDELRGRRRVRRLRGVGLRGAPRPDPLHCCARAAARPRVLDQSVAQLEVAAP
eukprot:1856765-Prymnesium_polylepis.1